MCRVYSTTDPTVPCGAAPVAPRRPRGAARGAEREGNAATSAEGPSGDGLRARGKSHSAGNNSSINNNKDHASLREHQPMRPFGIKQKPFVVVEWICIPRYFMGEVRELREYYRGVCMVLC